MIYTILVLLLIIVLLESNLQFTEWEDDDAIERRYVLAICFVLVIYAALRYIVPFTDMDGYVGDYRRIASMSFKDISERWPGYVGYFALSKIFSYTGLPYQYWLAFVAALFLFSFIRLLNRFSEDRIMAIFVLFTCGLFGFTLSGMKQTVAMSFAWLAFVDFTDRRFWRAVLFFVLAFLSHKSALIFSFTFLLWLLKDKDNFVLLVGLVCLVLIIFTPFLLSYMTDLLNDEHFSSYLGEKSGYTATTFFLYLLLFGIGFYGQMGIERESRSVFIDSIAAIATFVQLFALVVASAFRLGYYFAPFLCIMLSNSIKDNKYLRICVYMMLSIFMLYSGRNSTYKFFWQ